MNRRCVQVRVAGRVQGVWFRESTRRCAQALELSGWVRNLANGEVEALFSGDAESVSKAIAFVKEGPEHARVDDVQIQDCEEGALAGSENSFTIR